jgi:hypothetical protein
VDEIYLSLFCMFFLNDCFRYLDFLEIEDLLHMQQFKDWFFYPALSLCVLSGNCLPCRLDRGAFWKK